MPELIHRPRKAGKTSELVARFMEDPHGSVILCDSEGEARHVRSVITSTYRHLGAAGAALATRLDLKERVFSVSQMPQHLQGKPDRRIYVDNADLVLATLLGTNFHAASWDEGPG